MIAVLACSERIVAQVMGPPRRGLVQSAFSAAANLLFPHDFLLSLNALPALTTERATTAARGDFACEELALMPNGLALSAQAGMFPFRALKAGMPVVLGAGRLVIDAISCSLDCSGGKRWNPRIERPRLLEIERIKAHAAWLARFCAEHRPQESSALLAWETGEPILALAARICGRGRGLTPSGDDFLAGWLAAGWLLYGPQPGFLACCQAINEIARRQTHALSQCWLAYAAAGDVAYPIGTLVRALHQSDQARLEQSARAVLSLGATSGYDLLQGLLYGIAQFPLF